MEFFDTHAHLNDEKYAGIVPDIINEANKAGVANIATIGYDLKSSIYSVYLAEKFAGIHAAVGIHPHDADTLTTEAMNELYDLAKSEKTVAWGEIGLDYYRDLSPRDIQKKAFVEQIHAARELNLPILIHDRDAHGDVVATLKKENGGKNGGIIHCFSGSLEMAEDCIKMGFYISFAGPVTYPNARKLQAVAQTIPLERILIETDCPYLTPQTFRGKTNYPAYVVETAKMLAELRGITLEEVAKITTANAKTVYNLK